MNHLEPLSWDAHASGAPLATGEQDELIFADQLPSSNPAMAGLRFIRSSLSIRSIFGLIDVFRRGAGQSVSTTSLAMTACAALELARVEFALGQWQPWFSAGFLAESDRCVAELEALVGALSEGKELALLDLTHAFDALIVLLARIDGLNGQGDGRPFRRIGAGFASEGDRSCAAH